jgi:hypothetical protein
MMISSSRGRYVLGAALSYYFQIENVEQIVQDFAFSLSRRNEAQRRYAAWRRQRDNAKDKRDATFLIWK